MFLHISTSIHPYSVFCSLVILRSNLDSEEYDMWVKCSYGEYIFTGDTSRTGLPVTLNERKHLDKENVFWFIQVLRVTLGKQSIPLNGKLTPSLSLKSGRLLVVNHGLDR